ncbi:hypothetical protein NKH53_09750 [Mesorhizobium australicum]|uniref:hypothetical protein n=1 Tax=Mesorhizobium australicum TaxID=536018 RepID=UPI003334C9F5
MLEFTIPADDPNRQMSIVDPDDPSLQHLAILGDTYTILLSGTQTAGRFCLIDMKVPDGGGPVPTGMISRRRFIFWKARSSSPFVARKAWPRQA